MTSPQRFWVADYIGGDWIDGGFYVYLGPLFVRWTWRATWLVGVWNWLTLGGDWDE